MVSESVELASIKPCETVCLTIEGFDFQIQRLREYVALENSKVKTPLPDDRQFNT